MLDAMRQNLKSLQFVLWVVIAAFIGTIFLVWGQGGRQRGTVGGANFAASVNGDIISYESVQSGYRNLYNYYKQMFGENLNEDVLKNLKLEQQALNQLIRKTLLGQEARRNHLGVSDDELVQAIRQIPQFQRENQFDPEIYKAALTGVNLTPETFEAQMKDSLLVGKMTNLIQQMVRLSDQEVLDEYKMQNEKVQVEGILVKSAAFTDKVTMTDDEAAKYYDAHKETFKTPDRVKIQYLYFDLQRFKADVNPTEEDIKQYYTEHESEYNKGKEVKARHILFRLAKDADQATEATIKQKAEDVLQKLKAGADFAELAKQYSEDPGTAKDGGDLGFFSKGMMVPEFEEKAFIMNPGDISDLIRTDYGYHILKVDEIREEPDPYGKAKPMIVELLKVQGSRERVVQQMEASYQDLLKTKDLQKIAANTGTEVRVSQFFAKGEPIDEKTQAIPQVQEAAFALSAEDKFSEPIETPSGYYVVEFLESKPSYIPELKDITEHVQTALRKEKAKDLAKAEAQTVEADLKNGADWEAVIQKYTLEKLAPEPFSRRQNYLVEFPGKAEDVIKIAFGLKEGERSAVIELPENYCLLRMMKKIGIDEAKFTIAKDTLQKQLLQQKQSQVLQDFVEELKQKADIKISDRMAG